MHQAVSIPEQATSSVQLRRQHLLAGRALTNPRRKRESGYLLLAVLLMMALMIIAATIEAPRIVQQMKRDREEEMIHRGTEYARAIKKFYKKFGRYPATLEQLENTNQLRFLRRHYKDPLTKDGKWKLLNYGDIQSMLNPNAPGTPAALAAQGQSVFGQPSAVTSVGTTGTPTSQSSTPSPGNILYTSSTGFDQSTPSAPQQQTGVAGNALGGLAGGSPQGNAQQGASPFANTFTLGSSSAANTSQPGSATGNQQQGGTATGNATLGQTFGGGALVGVASLSKDPTIRIYNKKKTYDEWVFIYNPLMDQVNGLLRGPYQPTTIGGAQIGPPAGQLNQSGQGAFGQQQSGFGQPSGSFGQQQNPPQQTSPVNQFPPDQNQPH
jgi:type II secretory pathway pseudopilin PulG